MVEGNSGGGAGAVIIGVGIRDPSTATVPSAAVNKH